MKKNIYPIIILFILIYLSSCLEKNKVSNPYPSPSYPALTSTVEGEVSDASTSDEIPGVTVSLGVYNATTNNQGEYSFSNIIPGTYTLTVSKSGYTSYSQNVTIVSGDNELNDISIYPAGFGGEVKGRITNGANGSGIEGVTVSIDETTTTTDSNGNYSIKQVPSTLHDITAVKSGYNDCSAYFTVVGSSSETINFTMYQAGTKGNLTGTVKNKGAITVIGGAQVSVSGVSGNSAGDGTYTVINIPAGTNKATCYKNSYKYNYSNVTIVPSAAATNNFELTMVTKLIRKQPYLLFTFQNTSMTVMWQTNYTPTSASIQWGYSTDYTKSAVVRENSSAENEHIFSYTIADLKTATKVYYKVQVDSEYYTGYFVTPPDNSAESVVFYGYGDTRTQPMEHDKVLKAVMDDMDSQSDKERHTFMIHGGDFVSRGLMENYWDDEFFNPDTKNVQKFLSMIPLISVIGNHECYKDVPGRGCIFDHKNGGKLLKKYWPYTGYPESDRFFISYDYGPVHLSAVDVYMYPTLSPGEQEYEWLDNDLKNSGKYWKIVFLHKPIYSSTSYSKELDDDLYEIFRKNGVKLIVQSHEHYYSRVDVTSEDIQYITVGGGGAPLSRVTPYNSVCAKYPIYAYEEYSFARFEIDKNLLKVTVLSTSGKPLDSFTIK